MGRWTQYDEDDYRLPEGMKRVGYDADTQKYTFRDQNGTYWEGPEGAEYGQLTKVVVGQGTRGSADLEATVPGYALVPDSNGDRILRRSNKEAWRQLLPFFLIIAVCLLLIFRLSPSFFKSRPMTCPGHSRPIIVNAGDTCWAIAKEYGTSLEKLRAINQQLDCASLMPGQRMCVPIDG